MDEVNEVKGGTVGAAPREVVPDRPVLVSRYRNPLVHGTLPGGDKLLQESLTQIVLNLAIRSRIVQVAMRFSVPGMGGSWLRIPPGPPEADNHTLSRSRACSAWSGLAAVSDCPEERMLSRAFLCSQRRSPPRTLHFFRKTRHIFHKTPFWPSPPLQSWERSSILAASMDIASSLMMSSFCTESLSSAGQALCVSSVRFQPLLRAVRGRHLYRFGQSCGPPRTSTG